MREPPSSSERIQAAGGRGAHSGRFEASVCQLSNVPARRPPRAPGVGEMSLPRADAGATPPSPNRLNLRFDGPDAGASVSSAGFAPSMLGSGGRMLASSSSDGTTRVGEDDPPRTPPARTDEEKIRAIRESLLAAVEGAATSPSSSRAPAPPAGDPPGDGVLVAESRVEPGAPVIFRLRAARDANPERLDLDRRSLDQCCLLEGEHRLRLLNYQHNAITRISRLESVRNLVFLDLYANAVETIGGLEATPGLRVLMLGRNRVRRITGLSHLARLDVLDLHNNRVESTSGLEGLASLRILNLAGNDIAFAGDLRTLESLAELNLRRNRIEDLAPGSLPRRLKRCFLSHNPIRHASGLAPLRDVAALEELTLDGTPAATNAASRAAYRKAVVAAAPGVRVLDGDVVRVEEKSTAASAEAALAHAFANAQARVVAGGGSTSATTASATSATTTDAKTKTTPADTTRFPISVPASSSAVAEKADETRTAAAAAEALASPPAGVRPPAPRARAPRTNYAEFNDAHRRLTVYGHVDDLDRHPDAHRAQGVIFRHPRRPSQLASALRAIRRGMPRVVDLRFEDAGMQTLMSFVDVLARAGFGRGDGDGRAPIARLHVSAAGNPAARSTMYRALVVRRFPSLVALDGVEITRAERDAAAARFRAAEEVLAEGPGRQGGAAVVGSIPGTDAAYEYEYTPGEESALRAYVGSAVVAHASDIVDKLRALDDAWDDIARGFVAEGLSERTPAK